MLVATSMSNVGAVLQKKAVDALPPFDSRPLAPSVRAVLRAPLWVAGWAAGALAIVLNMVALGFADISIVQPLNGFGLVVLAIASRLLLGERPGATRLAGIGCVVGGVVLVGATASSGRAFASAAEIFACYTSARGTATIILMSTLLAGLWGAAGRLPEVAGIVYAFVAAACSVLGLTFAKGLFDLMVLAGLRSALSLWPSYVLLPLLLAGSFTAMVVQQLSFQKGRATVVTPVFAASSVLLPLVTGRFVFGEHLGAGSGLAVALIVPGVMLLGGRSATVPAQLVASGR